MSTVVFLGGGRITAAMLAGLRLGKSKHHLVVHDRNPSKLRNLKKQNAVAVEPDLKSAVKQADVLIVAVRPSSIRELLYSVGKMKGARLAISLAAGVPLRALSKLAGPPVKWARAMPSPVCRSGRGLTAVTFPRTLASADRKRVHDLFATFGQVVEIPESKFDAFTVTFSCSHGYHALATLARAAQEAGLDRRTALLASAHALGDGIVTWREGKHSLESLLQEAATPGGIAAATTTAMDAAGYGRVVRQGVAAGLRRARMNAGK
ncbi:MAG TPA: NAD(P)-binding domain-containing protein [Terriglobales bacterium]|jgi:pyrroline-5-carboxylate reductase|nr:NAD(P)-binding domain-containing protein [Terriglobales bacterium]